MLTVIYSNPDQLNSGKPYKFITGYLIESLSVDNIFYHCIIFSAFKFHRNTSTEYYFGVYWGLLYLESNDFFGVINKFTWIPIFWCIPDFYGNENAV
jgi:hypothetical protein